MTNSIGLLYSFLVSKDFSLKKKKKTTTKERETSNRKWPVPSIF